MSVDLVLVPDCFCAPAPRSQSEISRLDAALAEAQQSAATAQSDEMFLSNQLLASEHENMQLTEVCVGVGWAGGACICLPLW
jgi:hypothetical protein